MSGEITRNTPGGADDYVREMIRRERSEQREIDALLSGRVPAGEEADGVAVLVERLRSTASAQPEPSDELAVVLAEGLSADELAGAVADATEVHEPGSAARPLVWRRGRKMLEIALAKVAALGLAAKVGVASVALVAGATGAGVAGVPVLDGLDRVTPFDVVAEEAEETEEAEGANEHGQEVAETARTSDAEGCERGQEIAETARGHDAAETADVDPAAACPDEVGEGERPDEPGAEGRETADENAGESGAEGRSTADDAATEGRSFGDDRSSDAQNGDDPEEQVEDDPATSGQQTGEDRAEQRGGNAGSRP